MWMIAGNWLLAEPLLKADIDKLVVSIGRKASIEMGVVWKYIKNNLVAVDQLWNTLAFGAPDETVSSRLGRNYRGSWLERAVDWGAKVITGKPDHCEEALEPPSHWEDAILAMKEENRKQVEKAIKELDDVKLS